MIFISFSYVSENVCKCVWNDSPGLWRGFCTGHGVSLAGASLTVCEDCSIVALQYFVNYWPSCFIVDIHLGRVRVKHSIKGEDFWRFSLRCIWILYGDLAVQSIYLYYVFTAEFKFLAAQWAHSHHYSDILYLSQLRCTLLNREMLYVFSVRDRKVQIFPSEKYQYSNL